MACYAYAWASIKTDMCCPLNDWDGVHGDDVLLWMKDVSNGAVEVWSGYRVGPSAAGNNAPVCQRCGLVDCLSQCYSDDSCYAVDYDVNDTTCYTLNATIACSSLTPVSQFIHVSTAHCGNLIRSVRQWWAVINYQ